MSELKILSLGWGIQSTTLAFMAAAGELEPVDFAIHADTGHESALTYAFAERWTGWLEDRGVKVVTVKNKNGNALINPSGGISIPAYTLGLTGNGQTHRQCTFAWKIAPMRRYIQANRNGTQIEQWLGISLDEFQRMKDSDVKYITHRWPLIEKKMTRADCENWLKAHDLEVPPKSSCTFCPFHSTKEWRRIKANPDDWAEAVAVDEAIRKARPPYDLFVHPSRKPLTEVDLRTAEEKGQLSLWNEPDTNEECSGTCFV